MQQTNFNYIIPSEDNGISNPDTGVYTNVSINNDVGGSTNYFINSATIIGLALILLSFIFFVIKRKENKNKAFNDGVIDLKYKNKNNIISSIFATILLLSGLVTLVSSIINYHATATLAPNDDFTTKKDVTTTVTLGNTDSVTACATDTVTMTKALAHGYTLSFTASDIDPAISSITEYELTIDDETTPTTITPDEAITIKDITTATSAGDTTTVKLCVSFPEDIEPGTYTITGTYDSITNTDCAANEICYNDNGANSPTTMSNQTISSYATAVTLWPSNFQYTGGGYGFAGWNTKANGTGTSYGPNEDITDETVLNKIKSEGLDLYANWIPSAGNLQNWNGCNTMNIGDVTALTDTRDNNTYAVAKLADNKCWMMENLRLGGEEAITLTSSDSNMTAGSSFTLSATQDPTTNAWCAEYNSAACVDQSMLSSNNTTNTISNMSSVGLNNNESKGIYSMGNYYNWYSATTGTGTYSVRTGNATGSICPAGWHLPTGTTNGEFSALDIAMGGTGAQQDTTEASNRWRTYPANYIYSGLADGSSLDGRGFFGTVWSSTARSSNDAYELGFDSGSVGPGMVDGGKYVGFSVRCAF